VDRPLDPDQYDHDYDELYGAYKLTIDALEEISSLPRTSPAAVLSQHCLQDVADYWKQCSDDNSNGGNEAAEPSAT
jgi:hypothetical protein